MCRAIKNGELLTNENQVLARWKEHFEEHLNEGSESEQSTRPVGLRDDGVDIDFPSREEIEGALKYLKNNNAELLENGGPNLVDALHEVIQQAWTSKTVPRSWTEGVLCPVYKKGDKLDCKNYRGISLLNVTNNIPCQHSIRLPFTSRERGRSALPGWVQVNQKQTNSLHCAKS
jgi:hypothetical protein